MPGCADRGLAAGRDRRAAELAQPLFELAVSVLQFLVLAGELPQLVLEPLDPHFRVAIIGLRLAAGHLAANAPMETRAVRRRSATDEASITAIAAAPVALRNLDDILP